jgi:hypothetical protein
MARTAISSRRQTPGGANVTDSGHGCTPSFRVFSLSGLDAAAKVLVLAGKPMNTEKMVAKMLADGLWKTGGRTPASTIYAAMLREVRAKGKDARFRKTERGKFEATEAARQ